LRSRRPTAGDVTALLLTVGEATTERALDSIRRQTLAPAETIVVEGVAPFWKALQKGAAKVDTPFFVQVDADMVLDETCLERLRGAMAPEVGIAVGQLRDPLLGTIAGVKVFRRACFDATSLRDSVASDVAFYLDIAALGWLTLHVLSYDADPRRAMHTFGDHMPAYTPAYTWATYYLLGCRYVDRSDLRGFLWRLGRLRRSRHAMATVARVALCAGLFADQTRDVAKSSVTSDAELLGCLAAAPIPRAPLPVGAAAAASDVCERYYGLGRALAARGGCAELRSWLANLGTEPPEETWIAEASLCRGFLSTRRSETASAVRERLGKLQRPLRAPTVRSR
jgi:hypothetical protein